MKIRSALLIFSAFCTFCVSAQWTWRNPLPQGNMLSGLHFLSPSEGFAAGGYGSVMKTQDGGTSWILSQVNETATADPTAIFMTSSSNGYIIDFYGEIYRTQDGGQSWVQICDLNEDLQKLWFLNDSVGFVIGDEFGDGFFQKTTDFGLSWEDAVPGAIDLLTDIWFVDSLTGYVSGDHGVILKTINGGESWFSCGNVDSTYVSEIRFVSGVRGFAISAYPSYAIYGTNDGGNNWIHLATFDSSEVKSMFPFNGDTILISGEDVSGFLHVDFLSRSVDGGINWTPLPLPQNFMDLKNFYGFSDGTVFATNEHAVVKSVDHGSTWLDGSRDVARNIISDIHFPSMSTGYALCSFPYSYTDTRILKTTDGGESWDSISNLGGYLFNSIFFTSENHGIITGYNASQTWDGGLSWSQVLPGISGPYNAVYFSTPTRGFIVADNGKMVKSEDSGQSWTEVPSGTDKTLLCIHFPDPMHGYISGLSILLRTSDGGETWTLTEPFGNDMIRGIYFTSPDTGYVCGTGNGGCIYKTTDGGINWTDLSFITPANGWNSCFFIDADTGYVAGWEHFPIMKTRDGGQTWEKQHLPTRNWIHKILFTTPETGFAVGWGSTIISTTNGGYTGIGTKQNYPELTSTVYPNPANATATVEYVLYERAVVSITVYSSSGKIIYHLPQLVQQPGIYKLPLAVFHLPNGLYLCRICYEDHTETIKVVVLH
jgi:photosystem II stability/assembly factor-like uncharacterized protein